VTVLIFSPPILSKNRPFRGLSRTNLSKPSLIGASNYYLRQNPMTAQIICTILPSLRLPQVYHEPDIKIIDPSVVLTGKCFNREPLKVVCCIKRRTLFSATRRMIRFVYPSN